MVSKKRCQTSFWKNYERNCCYTTNNKTYQIIIFTVWFSIQRIEWLALQINSTMVAHKALGVIDFIHCSAATVFAQHLLSTLDTKSIIICLGSLFHPLHQQISERIYLLFLWNSNSARWLARTWDVAVRCIQWIVRTGWHLTWRTGVDRFIDWFICRWSLRSNAVIGVVLAWVRCSAQFTVAWTDWWRWWWEVVRRWRKVCVDNAWCIFRWLRRWRRWQFLSIGVDMRMWKVAVDQPVQYNFVFRKIYSTQNM